MKKIKIGSNKSFGIVFFIFFLIVSFYPLLNAENIRVWSLILSLIFLFLGLLKSNLLTPLNILWFKLGLALGKFFSPIVMGLVFFIVVTPTGMIMRLFKKDLLRLKKSKFKTYWIDRSEIKSKMENQF